jgi:type VII secretion protein EccB
MAGLRLTTKVQVSGWRFLLRRLEHAIVRRDTRMFDDPLQFYSRSAAAGIVVAVMIVVGALAMAYFKPQGKLGSGNLFVDRTTNEMYLMVSGQLHPVYNLTSARLVLGNPVEPTSVKSGELKGLPKGQYVGIPGAPYATPVSSDWSSVWALCDTVTGPETANVTVQTSVLAMPLTMDSTVDPLLPNEALLASFQGKDWIITATGRHATDLSDRPLTSALGIPINAKPSPISAAMFNALPDAGSWELPPVPNAGQPNTLGLPEELVIGSVFQIQGHTGPEYFVVLPDGAAPINANTAVALRASQSHGLVAPPAVVSSLVVRIPERVYTSPLPDEPIKIVYRPEDPTLCWTWERKAGEQGPKTMVLTGGHLPINPSAMGTGIKQVRGTATVYMDGGKYVQMQSPDPRYGESLYYVDPQGVRYGVPDPQTAAALGLKSPKSAPWSIVRMLVDGPVLSKEAALLEHDTLPADPTPGKLPAGAPGASR